MSLTDEIKVSIYRQDHAEVPFAWTASYGFSSAGGSATSVGDACAQIMAICVRWYTDAGLWYSTTHGSRT